MVSKNEILSKLNPFLNSRTVVVQDQGVSDIINGILDTHQKYKNEYDKISSYFYGGDCYSTASNVWNYLKDNVTYFIESDNKQTLRSPAAILALPGDCKSYALFANGIMDSLRRKGLLNCDVSFRFAGYKNNRDYEHVFSVIKNGNSEIWIDPVLPNFNQKKQPTNYKDKKINMALIAMSGIPSSLPLGPSPSAPQQIVKNAASGNFLSTLTNLTGTVSSTGIPLVSTVASAVNLLTNLFKNKPNPNDWMGWPEQEQKQGMPVGTSANFFTKYDGDSVQNEAANIVSWINAYGINTVLGYNTWNKWTVTIEDIADKLTRGGFGKEAKQFLNAYRGTGSSSAPSVLNNQPTPGSTQAGMNIWVTVALAGAAIFAISKMKK